MTTDAVFFALSEACAAAMVVVEGERIRYANPAAATVTGHSVDHLVGSRFWEIVHPDDQDLVRERGFARLAAEGDLPERYEIRTVQGDGQVRRLEINPRRFDHENHAYLLVAAFDVTDRHEAQEALRQSEEKWRSLVNSVPDIVFTASVDGRILYINRVVEGQPEEYVGRDLYEFLDDDSRPIMRSAVDDVVESGAAQVRQVVGHGPNGRMSWYESRIAPLWRDGSVEAVLVITTDITARREVEERARQIQEQLAHVLRISTLGELAAGLAHELNQPLSSIGNYAFACRQKLRVDPVPNEKIVGYLQEIENQSLRAGSIIRRLRRLVRKRDTNPVRTDLAGILQDALALLRTEARWSDVEVEVSIPESGFAVLADPIQIQQVVLNLARNAIEAMRETPAAHPRRLDVRAMRRGRHAEVVIRDTGCGIAPEQSDRIFDQFFTTKPNGLGMGLAISRTIIETQNGRLWLSSNEEGGATSHFTLPIVGEDHGTT